jgi:hypothetical protein
MSDTPPSDDLERIEQLDLDLLVTPGDPSETHPRLFLGRIPENIPVELPLPEHAQATLPSASGSDCCALLPDKLQAWQRLWGGALMLVGGGWSGVLAYLQWRR